MPQKTTSSVSSIAFDRSMRNLRRIISLYYIFFFLFFWRHACRYPFQLELVHAVKQTSSFSTKDPLCMQPHIAPHRDESSVTTARGNVDTTSAFKSRIAVRISCSTFHSSSIEVEVPIFPQNSRRMQPMPWRMTYATVERSVGRGESRGHVSNKSHCQVLGAVQRATVLTPAQVQNAKSRR